MGTPALATEWFGCFLLEEGKVRAHTLFPQEAAAIAQRLRTVRDGGILEEERDLAGQVGELAVPGRRLLPLEGASIGSVPRALVRPDDLEVPEKLLREALLLLAEQTIRQELAERTRHLMQAVSYLDESFEVENLLGERLVAWLTLHTPELVDQVEDHAELARKLLAAEDLDALREPDQTDEPLGAVFAPREAEAVLGLARSIVEQVESRKPLETYISEVTREMAPNLATLVGPTIAARLIHQAGGLTDLAKLPSSTVQTLGAEKALFRHFTEGAPPPKHGVLFQHPLVHRAHPNDRGSITRALAGKASIAARVDAFGDGSKDVGAELKAEVEARAEEISRVGRRKAMAKRQGGS